MKTFHYSTCPHCEHPNIHVEDGRLCEHYANTSDLEKCLGSRLETPENRTHCLVRGTNEHRIALALFSVGKVETKTAFETWKFCGVEFLAVPLGRDFFIMNKLGLNYGAWMSVDEFRKRQQSGDLSSWAPLGSAYAQVVPAR